jgi:hypothetical protein
LPAGICLLLSHAEPMSSTVTRTTQTSTTYAEGVSRKDLPLQPNFTVDDLRNCIPPHCWNRSLLKSFSYLAWDLLLIGVTAYLAFHYIEDPRVPVWLQIPLWGLYLLFQVCLIPCVLLFSDFFMFVRKNFFPKLFFSVLFFSNRRTFSQPPVVGAPDLQPGVSNAIYFLHL